MVCPGCGVQYTWWPLMNDWIPCKVSSLLDRNYLPSWSQPMSVYPKLWTPLYNRQNLGPNGVHSRGAPLYWYMLLWTLRMHQSWALNFLSYHLPSTVLLVIAPFYRPDRGCELVQTSVYCLLLIQQREPVKRAVVLGIYHPFQISLDTLRVTPHMDSVTNYM